MQQTNFPIEIIVHDDASTDGTQDVIRQFENEYPEMFRVTYETENKYSNGYKGKMDTEFCYKLAKGKYIAYCEGDDYWTDPLKLQKQVDFLETHPDYSVTFHRCLRLQYIEKQTYGDDCDTIIPDGQCGITIGLQMFFGRWITQPLSMVFRKSMNSMELPWKFRYWRDMHQIYYLLLAGKGYLFSFVGGVYVCHSSGIASMISRRQYCEISLPMDGEFYRKTRCEGAKKTYLATLQSAVSAFADDSRGRALKCAVEHFLISGKVKRFYKNICLILNSGHKS